MPHRIHKEGFTKKLRLIKLGLVKVQAFVGISTWSGSCSPFCIGCSEDERARAQHDENHLVCRQKHRGVSSLFKLKGVVLPM
ncbi:hypothetical protein GOP47_0007216 [Adiantum capillus-veneris]|uniref:Uncharacterized protein n=1 Tax=Adiantum capillus-veneris TaxID=13818 RepID=A0A9D4ZKP6_ADICA|nr:hypothetical protein GOP47_0007216 [Adiantum capillus-veneris]